MNEEQQGLLWAEEDFLPTVAHRCLYQITRDFLDAASSVHESGNLPRAMDEMSSACLLIAEEYKQQLGSDVIRYLCECQNVMSTREMTARLDMLPWTLCRALLSIVNEDIDVQSYLVHYLTVGQSSIRRYALELAWIVRKRLTPDICVPPLLKNVADTILYWPESLALCSTLFPDKDSFWAAADAHEHEEEDFAEQYRYRIAEAKKHGIYDCSTSFLELESTIRKRVMDCAMMLRCK